MQTDRLDAVEVDGTMTLNETIRRWPATVEVFARFGLDTCCGGALPIQEAAGRHGHDPEEVLAALRATRPASDD
jgi:iron-sulfur cluster repair protein YtfE (RIC family)